MKDIQEISGNGVIATVDGRQVAAGQRKAHGPFGRAIHSLPQHGTIIHIAIEGKYMGHIVISDVIKPHSKKLLRH